MATKTFKAPGDATSSGSNGHRSPASDPKVTPPRSRIRIPELGIGLGVVVFFALGAVVLHLNATDQVPALAAAGDVARGEVVGAADVRLIYLSSGDPIAHLDEGELSQVVGRVALVDIPEGSLLSTAMVADSVNIGPGDAVAGVALEPGQYPALGLAVGDRVNVVRSTDTTGVDDAVIARGAVVFDVEDLSTDRRLVSLVTAEADAETIAAAAGSGTLRLVMVTR